MVKCKLISESSGGVPGFIKIQIGHQIVGSAEETPPTVFGYVILRYKDLERIEVRIPDGFNEQKVPRDVIIVNFGAKALSVVVDHGAGDAFVWQLCRGEVQLLASEPPGAIESAEG
jgi:hypothetical protein